MLKSYQMKRSAAEKSWLPWFGKNGKLALRWATLINRRRYPVQEQTFEGISTTRVQILTNWGNAQWGLLDAMLEEIQREFPAPSTALMQRLLTRMKDFSELFVIDADGNVICSSQATRPVRYNLSPKAIGTGLQQRLLHGPYIDPLTKEFGASSSKFHDAVTLMFYLPIKRDNKAVGWQVKHQRYRIVKF